MTTTRLVVAIFASAILTASLPAPIYANTAGDEFAIGSVTPGTPLIAEGDPRNAGAPLNATTTAVPMQTEFGKASGVRLMARARRWSPADLR